ncbi:MAG: hypothetical protein AB7D00_06855, partial [Rhodospirillaceae bacterium]
DNVVRPQRRFRLFGAAGHDRAVETPLFGTPSLAPRDEGEKRLAAEPADRPDLTGALDPQIDNIPAFLRRQAN